jgi:hypothetical protein
VTATEFRHTPGALHYFFGLMHQHGGVEAAKRLLRLPASSGLAWLVAMGRRDLTAEWLVLDPRFAPLFTDEERRVAEARVGP